MTMIENKDDWQPVRLEHVLIKREENDREKARDRFDTFVKVDHMVAESLHLRGVGSQRDEELPPTFYKIFRKDQILFPTRNPHLRRTALAHCEGICGEKTLTLEVNKEVADPELIPFLFHSASFYDHSAGAIIGSTNPHCRWRDIANYEFLLPPKPLQTNLAEILWAADQNLQHAEASVEKIETLIKAQRSAEFKENRPNKRIEDVASVRAGVGFPLDYQKGRVGEIPFIKVADMNSPTSLRVISEAKNHVTPETLTELKGRAFAENTVIFPKVGAAIATEKKRLLGTQAMVDNNIMGVSVLDESVLQPGYLFEYFNYISISALANAGTVPSINAATVNAVRVPVPDDLAQQNYLDTLQVSLDALEHSKRMREASKHAAVSLINQIF